MMRRRLSALFAPLLLAGLFALPHTASASQSPYCSSTAKPYNRAACAGYFTGRNANQKGLSVDSVIANGGKALLQVKSATDFTNVMSQLLNGGGSDATGAAFIVNTMLNHWGTDYGSIDKGVSSAKDHFNAWSDLVNDYDQGIRGSVNWNANNAPIAFNAPFQDSGRVSVGGQSDEVFYVKQLSESHPVITFFNSDGTTFKINKEDGSLIGGLGILKQKAVVYYPTVTNQQLQESQNNTAAQGVVKAFNGTTIVFAIDNPKQTVNLTVTASTMYTTGTMYTPASASGLKAGSRAVVSYNIKTNNVTQVAYGL
ncbi:MAG TPA: hypothetical protein VLG16_06055 [Candidatus Saccharimonadales bacterium]|nr:hypothetical protein [Candidatus Saccharimonadales bacterium]